jgi:cbb3-type cytochrome oxidase subunit 3
MLSQLSADYFARSPVMAFPIAALGLFLLVFIGVSVWAMSRTQRDIEHLAALPFEEKGEDHG